MELDKHLKWIKTALIVVVVIFFFHWIINAVMQRHTKELAPAVIAQKPTITKMTEYVTQTGTLVAYNAVDLVARIEGYLDEIAFTDGTFVKKGQLLFVIEPQPYLEQLKAAEAEVAVKKASYAYNKSEYERQKRMYKQDATSLNNVEEYAARTEESSAEIDKATANAAITAINYSYTHVLAPFDGRIGRHLVDPGNLVGNGKATDLATIEQVDPIYVYFNLNELDLIKIREVARTHHFNPANIDQIPVEVAMQNETDFPHKGQLNFVNTGLNASTGTLEFRAVLPNKDNVLLPGLFVQIRIPIGNPTAQVTIPNIAVQYDQIGPYVLTVNQKNIVVVKRVVLGALEQDARAIVKGLDAHDNVVVAGFQNATPDHPVTLVQPEKKV